MELTPSVIVDYLKTLSDPGRDFAFLKLDRSNRIVACGGDMRQCSLPALEVNTPVQDQAIQLSSLLPLQNEEADTFVIFNTQVEDDKFIDLHTFNDAQHQWVVLVDNTVGALKQQSEQQERVSRDLSEEWSMQVA